MAAWPPADVLDAVEGLARPAVAGLRWTTRDQWHVTLRFLGEVADPDEVVAALAGVDAAPADAELGPAVGRFGQRVVQVPVSGLDALAGAVVAATGHLGEPPDDRPFHGHLTLARAGRGSTADLRRLAGAPLAFRWTVGEITLIESRLEAGGARYSVLATFPL